MPNPSYRTIRQKNHEEKSWPFYAWLSRMMKKLWPNSSAKMPYIFPENSTVRMLNIVPSYGSVCVTASAYPKLKCSTGW